MITRIHLNELTHTHTYWLRVYGLYKWQMTKAILMILVIWFYPRHSWWRRRQCYGFPGGCHGYSRVTWSGALIPQSGMSCLPEQSGRKPFGKCVRVRDMQGETKTTRKIREWETDWARSQWSRKRDVSFLFLDCLCSCSMCLSWMCLLLCTDLQQQSGKHDKFMNNALLSNCEFTVIFLVNKCAQHTCCIHNIVERNSLLSHHCWALLTFEVIPIPDFIFSDNIHFL